MAQVPVIEFVRMDLRPGATVEQEGTEAHSTWQELWQELGRAPGCTKQWFGRQMEDDSVGIHVLGALLHI